MKVIFHNGRNLMIWNMIIWNSGLSKCPPPQIKRLHQKTLKRNISTEFYYFTVVLYSTVYCEKSDDSHLCTSNLAQTWVITMFFLIPLFPTCSAVMQLNSYTSPVELLMMKRFHNRSLKKRKFHLKKKVYLTFFKKTVR